METFELERSKRTLQAMLANVGEGIRKRDQIAVENSPDTIDSIQNAAARELAIRQIESMFARLQSVRLALERITDGTYGTCLKCEEEISRKRLEAVPWAAYCIRCQEIVDGERDEPDSKGFEILSRMHMRGAA